MATTSELLETVLGSYPQVLDALRASNEAAWKAVDPTLLELCRVRVAMLLGNDADASPSADELDPSLVEGLADWRASSLFDDRQRACLGFTEQFVIDVASMTDAQAEAVAASLGGDGLSNFVMALLVIEQRQRLRLAWSRILPEVVS
jgi:alkylhydroperoxidase family enzyme